MQAHAERLHAPKSPSSLEAREACPGWESRDEETIWANDGERCHEAIEAKLNGDDSKHNALPKDLHNFVTECYDHIAPRIAGADAIITEQTLYHKNPILREQSYGTPDVIAIRGSEAQIFDWKFGRRPVPASEHNLQGWTYTLGLFDTYDAVQTVSTHFVVPRVHRCTSSHTFTRERDYQRILDRVLATVTNSMAADDQKTYNVGWSSCAYCGRKATCLPIKKEIQNFMSNSVTDTDPKTLGDQLNMAKLAKGWAEQTETYILGQALNEGREVEGFEVRVAGGKTSTKSLTHIKRAVGDKIGVDELAEIATVPLNKLKDLYTENTEHETKTEAEQELMGLLIKGDALKTGEDAPYLYRLNKTK